MHYDFRLEMNGVLKSWVAPKGPSLNPEVTYAEWTADRHLRHSKRKERIYLDFLQNRKGQTIAAPYSVRPKPGATVSAPLEWVEVKDGLSIQQFDIFNMIQRIKEKGDLWENINKLKNSLKNALKQV